MGGKTATKAGYFDKLKDLLETYKSVFIVTVDNVSSQQMHEIRHSMRGTGVVLMGKNTMVCICGVKTYGHWTWDTDTEPYRSVAPSRPSSPTSRSTSASCPTSRVTSASFSPTAS